MRSGESVPPTVVRFTAQQGNRALTLALVREYERMLPELGFSLHDSSGSVTAVEAIQRGDADLGFSSADVAYFASVNPDASGNRPLRGISVLQSAPQHLIVRADSGIRGLSDLRDRRVAIGPRDSSTALVARIVLGAVGIDAPVDTESLRFDEAARKLLAGDLDAMFVGSAREVINNVMQGGAQLVPIEGAQIERLPGRYPFLKPASLARGTYSGQPDSIRTVAFDAVLVCRQDLDQELVYKLTRGLFEALPSLVAVEASLTAMDLSQAPTTPIPLHEGAARHYRELELFQ